MRLLTTFWAFLGHYQTPRIRIVHLCVFLLVIVQIVISNFMHVPAEATTPMHGANWLFSWMHITVGWLLLFLTLALIIVCLRTRGAKFYYPYLWGDFSQLRRDCRALWNRQLPGAEAGGLAATVQGLGLGAMLLVVASGVSWWLLWINAQPLAPEARALHKTLTGLVEVYIYGHGGMSLLHFWLARKQHI